MKRLVPCLLVAGLLLVACSDDSSAPTPAPADILAGKSAATLVKDAQTWLHTAHYGFHESLHQASTGTNLSGVTGSVSRAANGHIDLTADGEAAGKGNVSLTATIVGFAARVHVIQVGCSGFGSVDGVNWASGAQEHFLAQIMAPNIEDGQLALPWQDLGATTREGVAVHHLHATFTAAGLSGAAPSPGATPAPGVTVVPTPADLWLASADGSVVAIQESIDATADLSLIGAASGHPAAGILHQQLSTDVAFHASSAEVKAPGARLPADPIPREVAAGFGLFGVQTDKCLAQSFAPSPVSSA